MRGVRVETGLCACAWGAQPAVGVRIADLEAPTQRWRQAQGGGGGPISPGHGRQSWATGYCTSFVLLNPLVNQVRIMIGTWALWGQGWFLSAGSLRGNKNPRTTASSCVSFIWPVNHNGIWSLSRAKGSAFYLFTADRDSCQSPRRMKVVQQCIKFITGLGGDKIAPRAKVYGKKNRALCRPEIIHDVSRLTEVGRLGGCFEIQNC